ncbi:MAG: hypothetical protein IT581_00720 [Verrucomicrobiales bacterium]|nr:hypothetical protein [Verrucomicrobiales bacterium]
MKHCIKHPLLPWIPARAALLAIAFSASIASANVLAATSPQFAKPTADSAAKIAKAKDHLKGVANELGLTDEQKTKLREIFSAEREKIQDLRQDPYLNRREKLLKLRVIRDEIQAKVKAVLTAEQWEQWLKLRDDKREAIRARLAGG